MLVFVNHHSRQTLPGSRERAAPWASASRSPAAASQGLIVINRNGEFLSYMEQMFYGHLRMNTHYMVAWGSGFSHPGGLCQLMFLWWLIDQYWASLINTVWFLSCLAGQLQHFSYSHSEMLKILGKRKSSLLGKNLPKRSWANLNTGNVERNLLDIEKGLSFWQILEMWLNHISNVYLTFPRSLVVLSFISLLT